MSIFQFRNDLTRRREDAKEECSRAAVGVFADGERRSPSLTAPIQPPRFRRFTVDPWSKVRRAPRVFELHHDEPEKPSEPPHDPVTGEIPDERNPPPPAAEPPVDIGAEVNGPTLQAWMDGIRDAMPEAAARDKDTVAKAFWSQFVDELDKYKSERWLGAYVESRRPILDRWQASYPDLFESATLHIARAYGRIRGEDTSDFDPIGIRQEPIYYGDRQVG